MTNPTPSMRRSIHFLLIAGFSCLSLNSCFEAPEKKPVGPTSANSKIPWNQPISGQGQGQFGMLPTSGQYRR